MTGPSVRSAQVLKEEALFLMRSVHQSARYGAPTDRSGLVASSGAGLSIELGVYLDFLIQCGFLIENPSSGHIEPTELCEDELNGRSERLFEQVVEGLGAWIEEQHEERAIEAKGGTLEDRYERHDEIGRGGIGTVYRGTHIPLRRDVAIKEIKEIFSLFGDLQKDDIISRFETAVQQHAKLVHPGIVQILDIDVDQQFPFFVMEYAPGGSLRSLLDGGNKPALPILLDYFLQVCRALRYAHRQGVIHTDLKPENIVFDSDGNAKLVDFGISRIIERDSSKQQIYIGVGTVAYLSPEQFRNPTEASERSDIYSLGIMFYEMLTGKLPGRRSPMPSSFFPDIPRKLDDIFDNMCMDAEEDRYQSFDDIINDLTADSEVIALMGQAGSFVPPSISVGMAALTPPSPKPPAPTPAPTPAPAPTPEPEPEPEVEPEPTPEPVDEAPAEEESPSSADEAPAEEEAHAEPAEETPEEAAEGDGEDSDILAKLAKYGDSF